MTPPVSFDGLIKWLRGALSRRLPGLRAQVRMAPRPRPGWDPYAIPEGTRDGAALLLLYPRHDTPHLALTLRLEHLPHHGGQVSLPGGAVDEGESYSEAALREAREEIGADPEQATLLGFLTPLHIPVSRFVLYPVLAFMPRPPALQASDREVERLLEVPVHELCERTRVRIDRRSLDGRPREVPYFAVDGERVWGATAMVLAEFLWLLGCPPDPWGDADRIAAARRPGGEQ